MYKSQKNIEQSERSKKDKRVDAASGNNKSSISTMIIAAALLSATMYVIMPNSSSKNFKEIGEIVSLKQSELDLNRALLEANGVSKNFTVRDYAEIDGDKVIVNSSSNIPLNAAPISITGSPGELSLRAVAGTKGCVTVEIVDLNSVYQLCLRDGDPINTFIK